MFRGGRPMVWGAVVVAGVALTGCHTPAATPASVASPPRLSVRIDLRTAHATPGQPIRGTLVVENPGAAINLTQAEEGPGPARCRPGFAVILTRGSFRNAVGFTTSCVNEPFVLSTGTTRLPFTVLTVYGQCSPANGASGVSVPVCVSPGQAPSLPGGRYRAVIEWSETVPLPTPAPVLVILS